MSKLENNIALSVCANCGKGEENSGDLKSCNACKMVKYCNRDCQIAHRPQHKKACKKRAAELHDKALFKEVEPEECPVCFRPFPNDDITKTLQTCCGKMICYGCIFAMGGANAGTKNFGMCPFCREKSSSSTEKGIIKKGMRKLMDAGNGEAFNSFGMAYATGENGTPQDWVKANELYLKGGELGCADAYYNLANSYDDGNGVQVDKKKARHYWELAAMSGQLDARHNLACLEGQAGNYHRAYKHFMVAARAGDEGSMDAVKRGFMNGFVTKVEYANALRAYEKIRDEMTSESREKAVALFLGENINREKSG